MTSTVERDIARILSVQVRLYACRERLLAVTDDEALHDLRIALRRLRSILRPLRGLPGVALLEQTAGALGRLSGPVRDREVLLNQLQQLGYAQQAQAMAGMRQSHYRVIAESSELRELLALLDAWPGRWRQAEREGQLNGLNKRIRRQLHKQQGRLARALREPQQDRHELRLLIKRVRYGAEAYVRQSAINAAALKRLRSAQSALGDWHDRLQWLALAESEPGLHACQPLWREALAVKAEQADVALLRLLGDFPLDE
ncbi:Metal-chelation protein CHAD [Pseudomonas sp. 8Z]|uniref:CHAD domain-containing protein n=1 Tax=Pseudomonas sp. 8Z TaxID=2653166 RepID=UPI0012F09320|nr:CHAD domain-containing protein [Pseudomonas sp. 8Z]VXD01473.1 Metal-chelation protein CHAD [Pseudomonas sp. 8Z]